MNVHLKRLVDDLDTGLPSEPDLDAIRTAGRSRRRRSRATVGVGLACVAALAVGAPLGLVLTGPGDDETPSRMDRGAAASPVVLAGPDFGPTMRATVEAAVPGMTWRDESLTDDWDCGPRVCDPTVQVPPRWETLVSWAMSWDLASGAQLDVSAERMSSTTPADGPVDYCAAGTVPSERSCDVREVDDRIVVIHDGIQFGQDDTHWNRFVEVYTPDGVRGMDSLVSTSQFATADTWRAARRQMVPVEEVVAFALDEDLVLPEPAAYPPTNPDQGAFG